MIITQTLTCHSFAILGYPFTDKPIASTCTITSEDSILRVAFDESSDGSQTAKDIAARLTAEDENHLLVVVADLNDWLDIK